TMASLADKGKEVAVTYKGFKRLRKGTKGSSSSAAKEGGLEPRVALHLSSLPPVVLFASWGREFAELK
ncbi:hypothetical protein HAX54_010213, partial [Datura stramonium]|nr:hypothetical protein [Datura stramonium]